MDQIVIALLAFACTVLLPFLAWALLALAHAAHRLHKAKSSGHEDKIGRVN
jgi:hypothetical protein